MSHHIIWCIANLPTMCVIISLLIAIVTLIKSKLNIFIFIILFCSRKSELGKTPTLNPFDLHPFEFVHLH